jgi:hypothetical protein
MMAVGFGHLARDRLFFPLQFALPALAVSLSEVGDGATEVQYDGKRFIVRSAPRPAAGLAPHAAGIALPRTVRDARGLLTPPHRKCSDKPPARRGLTLPVGYLTNRTVEDG